MHHWLKENTISPKTFFSLHNSIQLTYLKSLRSAICVDNQSYAFMHLKVTEKNIIM